MIEVCSAKPDWVSLLKMLFMKTNLKEGELEAEQESVAGVRTYESFVLVQRFLDHVSGASDRCEDAFTTSSQ